VIEFDVPVVTQSTDYQFTLFVRDSKNEPSSQQRFVVTAVPASSSSTGGDTPAPTPVPDPEPTPVPTPTPDTSGSGSAPYALWDASTI